jgi:hypothetical protein
VSSSTPLVLAVPEPGAWAVAADAEANRKPPGAADDETADAAAVFAADMLRVFADTPVEGVLAASGRTEAALAPILNVARHYRWDIGIRGDTPGGAGPVVDFRIGACGPGIVGVPLPRSFWDGKPPPAVLGPGFWFAEVPADAVPESVLGRLAVLREA